MDPERFRSLGGLLNQYASGANLDQTNNPIYQNYVNSVGQATGRMAAENQAGIRSRFAQAGQTSTGGSNPLLQAQENAQNIQAQTMQEALAPAALNLFNTEQARQLQAIGALGQYEQTPMDMFRQYAGMFNATNQTTPGTGWGSILASMLGSLA
jgi:hypothetical protein